MMTTLDLVCRLLAAHACGAAIGINRDLHHKSAGYRTISMVSTGAAIVALTVGDMSTDPNAASRVVQGVVTGIGFLGAGLILHPTDSVRVLGLTTAAAVWLAAGLGMACGFGEYRVAGVGIVMSLVILVIGGPLEKSIERLTGRYTVKKAGSPPAVQPPDDE